jgi:hypothetical protein
MRDCEGVFGGAVYNLFLLSQSHGECINDTLSCPRINSPGEQTGGLFGAAPKSRDRMDGFQQIPRHECARVLLVISNEVGTVPFEEWH